MKMGFGLGARIEVREGDRECGCDCARPTGEREEEVEDIAASDDAE